MAEQVSANTATSKTLSSLHQHSMLFIKEQAFNSVTQKAGGVKRRELCGRLGYYNLYKCCRTEDSEKPHSYLSSTAPNASTIPGNTQEAAAATRELTRQPLLIDIASCSESWAFVVNCVIFACVETSWFMRLFYEGLLLRPLWIPKSVAVQIPMVKWHNIYI